MSYYTVPEVAIILECSRAEVVSIAKRCKLWQRNGLIKSTDLDKFREARREK